jgi:hypothetical protein
MSEVDDESLIFIKGSVLFITLKIWFFIFIEYSVWHLQGEQLCRLRRERHRIRLAKAKEERYLELQRKKTTHDFWSSP